MKYPLLVIVDDDPPVLAALRRLFRREPYEIMTTDKPEEALARVRTGQVSLVIADQRMPAMLGTDLLREVRKASRDTICVILTGHADLGDVAGAMNEGAVDRLVKKPWDEEEFRKAVRQLLAREDSRPKAPGDGAALPCREVARLDCAQKTVPELLAEFSTFIQEASNRSSHPTVVFKNLRRVPGSLTALLSEIVKQIVRSRHRAALVDESGTVNAYISLVGRFLPVVVYSSESEIPSPRRVLVVEDQLESLDYLWTVIESAGHRCERAGTVAEAIRKLDSTPFDVVMLDLVLSDSEGLEVVRHLLERGLKIPVIAVSARPGLDEEAGIRQQVRKPFRAREILEAIQKI